MDKRNKAKRISKHNIWDRSSNTKPKHNDRDIENGLYYNEHKDEWVKRASRKVIKSNSDIRIYNFSVFDLEDIRRTFGKVKVERVGAFLSLVYERSFVEGYNVDEWKGVYLSTDELKMLLGKDWNKIIIKLTNRGVIDFNKKSSKYRGDRNLRYFKLGEFFIEDMQIEYDRVEIKDARFEKSLLQYFKKGNDERIGILKSVERTLDRCNLVIEDIDSLINSLFEQRLAKDLIDLESDYVGKKQKDSILTKTVDIYKFEKEYKRDLKRLYNLLVHVIQKAVIEEKRGLYRISKDAFGGRLYHLFSNVPKEFRKRITIDGEELVEVDITASQPSFLCLLFAKGEVLGSIGSIIKKYKNAEYVRIAKEYKMDVYKYMAVKLKGREYENDPITRANMKKVFFQLIFGNPKDKVGVYKRKELCDNLFGQDFYMFLSEVAKLDLSKGFSSDHKNLSFMLQTIESKYLNFVMAEMGNMSFLPMHDSVVVKKSDAKAVKKLFKKMIFEHELKEILLIS